MNRLATFVFAALAFTTQACTTHVAKLDTPDGFARLEEKSSYAFRATSPQGVVVAARSEPNELHASADFWAQSIDLKLERAGYRREGQKDVATSSGFKGKQLRYMVSRGGREHRYWVSVFTQGARVILVEAGGDAEPFEKSEAAVEKAMASVETQ